LGGRTHGLLGAHIKASPISVRFASSPGRPLILGSTIQLTDY
jgi:hypothetical protein